VLPTWCISHGPRGKGRFSTGWLRFATGTIVLSLLVQCCMAQEDSVGGKRIDVPFVAQVKNGCGSAVLAMLHRYWQQHGQQGATTTPSFEEIPSLEEIHQQVYSPKAGGSPASAVERYLQKAGFQTFAVTGSWSDLEEHIGQGRPVAVALRPGRASRQLHYVLVVGISEDRILLHDPAHAPNQLLLCDEFERQWRPARRWMLLALPAQ
jgi:ABC-type bacteriocin/lantibiotic exporter with double-glycine peptidase domain